MCLKSPKIPDPPPPPPPPPEPEPPKPFVPSPEDYKDKQKTDGTAGKRKVSTRIELNSGLDSSGLMIQSK